MESEANDLANSFLSENEDGDYASEGEEFFVSEIKLLQTVYSLYFIQKFNDEMSGSSESDETKEEIKGLLLEIKE